MKKEIGEPSLNVAMFPNVATLRSYDVQPTSANVVTSPGLTQREFFRYNKKNEETKRGRNGIQDGDDYTYVTREIM